MVARRFSGSDEQQLIQMYNAGATQEVLARHFRTTSITVRSSLRRAGLKIRGPGGPRRRFSVEEIKTICSLYQEGVSQERIAQRLETSQSKVSLVLRKQGICSQRGAKYGQKHPLWLGGRITTPHGYILVKADLEDEIARPMITSVQYVMEHRLVMAHRLGRSLEQNESVHHINGNRSDNRIENLQLRQGKHGNGVVYTCLDCGSHNVVNSKLH